MKCVRNFFGNPFCHSRSMTCRVHRTTKKDNTENKANPKKKLLKVVAIKNIFLKDAISQKQKQNYFLGGNNAIPMQRGIVFLFFLFDHLPSYRCPQLHFFPTLHT